MTADRAEQWVRGEIDDETYFADARAEARRRVQRDATFARRIARSWWRRIWQRWTGRP